MALYTPYMVDENGYQYWLNSATNTPMPYGFYPSDDQTGFMMRSGQSIAWSDPQANAIWANQVATNPNNTSGFFGSFFQAIKEAAPGVALVVAAPFALGALGIEGGLTVGSLAAGADTLTVASVGDAALPGGGISVFDVASAASNSAMVGEEVVTAAAAAAGTIPAASATPALTGFFGFAEAAAGGIAGSALVNAASAASNSAMVGEEVITAEAAAAGTIPAASATPGLGGFVAALPAAGVATGITLGDAATIAQVAKAAAATTAAVSSIAGGMKAPSSVGSPFYTLLNPDPAASAVIYGAQPAAASASSWFTSPLGIITLSGVALLALKLLAAKG